MSATKKTAPAPAGKNGKAPANGKASAKVGAGKVGKGNEFDHPIFHELQLPSDVNNLYRQTVGSMLQAADLMGLPHQLKIILAQPKNEIMVHFPVRMDDGTFKLFKGYRVQHNNALGP
jgi:glutamate dehydrogenase (NAD(P)+)